MDIERWSIFFGKYITIDAGFCEITVDLYLEYGRDSFSEPRQMVLDLMLAGF